MKLHTREQPGWSPPGPFSLPSALTSWPPTCQSPVVSWAASQPAQRKEDLLGLFHLTPSWLPIPYLTTGLRGPSCFTVKWLSASLPC